MVHRGVGSESSGGPAGVADPPRPRGLERLGRLSAKRRWWVLGAWLLIAVALGAAAAPAGKPFRDVFTIPGTDSQAAIEVLDQRFPQANLPSAQVVLHDSKGAVPRSTVTATSTAIGKLPQVESVAPPKVSANGETVLLTVTYSVAPDKIDLDTIDRLDGATAAARDAGSTVAYGGQVIDFVEQQTAPQNHADEIGLLAAVIILMFVFGTVVAAFLPLIVALTGVTIATLALTIIATGVTVGTVAPILGSMIGLGVGIDYSLLIVSRFRQERDGGMPVHDAIGTAIGTAGSASLFAGMCVAIALCGLWFAGVPYVSTLGFSSALFVAVMVLAALTLLPALLGVLGPHINRLRVLPKSKKVKEEGTGFWYRWGHEVARRAWLFVVASLIILLALAAPALSMRLGFTTDADAPIGTTQRDAYDLVTAGFGAGQNGPLLIAVALPQATAANEAPDSAAAEKLLAAIQATPGVESVTPPLPNSARDAAVALGDTDRRAERAQHRDARAHAARRGDPRGHEGHGARGPGARRRRDRGAHRPDRPHELAAGAGHRLGGARRVHPADDGVPLDPRPAQGRDHEPALDRCGVRRDRRRLPMGLGQGPDRAGGDDPDRRVRAGDDVRDPLRPLDGLRGVPPLADPGGVSTSRGTTGRRWRSAWRRRPGSSPRPR